MVLHDSDHPLAALDNRAINLESGTSNRLILSKNEVQNILFMCETIFQTLNFPGAFNQIRIEFSRIQMGKTRVGLYVLCHA